MQSQPLQPLLMANQATPAATPDNAESKTKAEVVSPQEPVQTDQASITPKIESKDIIASIGNGETANINGFFQSIPVKSETPLENKSAFTLSDEGKIAETEYKDFNESYKLSFDDSSDDESIQEKYDSYNIDKNWFDYARQFGPDMDNNEKVVRYYSFIVHAMGLRYLYSPEVNRVYYTSLKPVAVPNLDILQLNLSGWLQEQLNNIIAFITNDQCKNYFHPQSSKNTSSNIDQGNIDSLCKSLQKSMEDKINSYSSSLKLQQLFFQLILRQEQGKQFIPEIMSILEPFISDLFVAMLSLIKEKFVFNRTINTEMIDWDNEQKLVLKFCESPNLIKRAKDMLCTLHYSNKEGASPTKAKRDEWSSKLSKNIYQKLEYPGLGKSALKSAISVGTSKASVDTPLKRDEQILAQSYIIDLINRHEESEQSAKFIWEYSSRYPALRKFLRIDEQRMFELIKISFNCILKKILLDFNEKANEIINFPRRSTLNDTHHFDQGNIVDFLANIRLSNRSQKRHIRNLKNSTLTTSIKTSKKALISTVSRSWSFLPELKPSYALETQSVIASSFGREDYVLNSGVGNGSYADVIQNIKGIIKIIVKFKLCNEHMEHAKLAEWLRLILVGKSNEVKLIITGIDLSEEDKRCFMQLLTAITYLIFGCEVARNPASIIANQMMLDLIIGTKLTWEKAINEYMPMSPSGMVAHARNVHDEFNAYMPCFYKYDGTAEKEFSMALASREKKMLSDWIDYLNKKNGEPVLVKNPHDSQIAHLIDKESERWFNGEFKRKFTDEKVKIKITLNIRPS